MTVLTLSLLAAVVAIIGIVQVVQGQVLFGLLLIVVALLIGPGGYSVFTRRTGR